MQIQEILECMREMDGRILALAALAFVAVMNIISFRLMGADKRRAQRGEWRIPERTLFLATACFGGLGGVLGMKVFRHKTRHWYFRLCFPLLLAIQIAALGAGACWLFMPGWI